MSRAQDRARISARRLERFGVQPDKLDAAAWWQQIGEAAADLGLDAGASSDWQVQPAGWEARQWRADEGELL